MIIANGKLRYRDEILLPHALPYASATANGLQLVDNNARPHRVTRQMNSLIKKTAVIECNDHKKVQIFNQSCECSYERPH